MVALTNNCFVAFTRIVLLLFLDYTSAGWTFDKTDQFLTCAQHCVLLDAECSSAEEKAMQQVTDRDRLKDIVDALNLTCAVRDIRSKDEDFLTAIPYMNQNNHDFCFYSNQSFASDCLAYPPEEPVGTRICCCSGNKVGVLVPSSSCGYEDVY